MNIYKIIDNGWGDIGEQEEIIALIKAKDKKDALNKFYHYSKIPNDKYDFKVQKLYKEEQDLVNFVRSEKDFFIY